jgi:transposase InsO family protein
MKMVERGIPTARAAVFTGLSRRAMYLAPTPEKLLRPRADEPQIRLAIREVALTRPTFGHRRVWAMLRRSGRTVNRKRIHRLMKAEGLLRPAHYPRPRLPSKGSLSAEVSNQKWSTDLTDVLTTDMGVCHLTAVADACTREIAAWEFFPRWAAADALSLVEKALWARSPTPGRATDLILKTDAGSQFNCCLFRDGVRTVGTHLDMICPKTPEDNGLEESFHGHLKGDYLWLREAESFLETRTKIATLITDYNEGRPHSSLNYMTPKEYAQKKQEEQQT